jgi:hypothetical protein
MVNQDFPHMFFIMHLFRLICTYFIYFLGSCFICGDILTWFVCLQQPRYVDPLNITAMACPALPLCPLAITEAERGIPDLLKRVRAVFEKV